MVAVLDFCERYPFAWFFLNVAVIGIVILISAFVLTVIIPVLLIIVLLIGKFCVPIAVTIFSALSDLLNI